MTIVFSKARFSSRSSVRIVHGALRVEVAGRLVGDEQVRVGDDGARDRDALLLAARQLLRAVAGAMRQADGAERKQRRAAVARRGGGW